MEWKISDNLIDYEESLKWMEDRVASVINGDKDEAVWLLEHPPLYTAGTSANDSDLLIKDKFPVYRAGRGGEYTYHGPGQRVAYVILNLKARNSQDIRKYVYNLEEWIINSLKHFGVNGERRSGRVGIWTFDKGKEAKIAAIGVRIRKWVTFHGISLNINPDLTHFNGIVPCGISEYGVTSLENLGIKTTTLEVDEILKKEFTKIFKGHK